jgi:hypothetical protein
LNWENKWDVDLNLTICIPKAELVQAHEACLSSRTTKKVELTTKWTDALKHERKNHERALAIQAAQHVEDRKKAERQIGREWKSLTATLQKEVGGEQTRVADIQIQWNRAEKTFKECVLKLELKLAKQNMARLQEQDGFKVRPNIGTL